mmetsp:Transcript_14363/g.35085  ORF Transcript_14363/g.35085 Transcript_14363/m.35085 type:complete len:225 (-) Transcript_14363:2074-2748(-)
MNTYTRSQGMDNRLNMLFNQELDNEAQYIKSHPFSSINMSLGGEVRYIAPIWPWNAPRFQAIDWRTQPPPRRLPGETKHDRGKIFELPKTWNETTNTCWSEDQKPPPAFPHKRMALSSRQSTAEPAGRNHGTQDEKGYSVTMTRGAVRSQQGTPNSVYGAISTPKAGMPKDPLRVNQPVSMLPGRNSRPETSASRASSRVPTAMSHRSNASARSAAERLLQGAN